MFRPRTSFAIERLDPLMIELLRRKSPAEKLAAAHAMWAHARRRLIGVIRQEHPDWDDERVKDEIRRKTFGMV